MKKDIDIEQATPEEAFDYILEKGEFAGFIFNIPGCGVIHIINQKIEHGILSFNLTDYDSIFKKIGNYAFREFRKGFVADKKRFQIFKRDNFKCQYCGRSSKDGAILEIDHIIPKSKGGTDDMDNLITSCKECNRGKSAELLDE